jgi:MFS transporter, putative metabolite:H+ symporter
LAERVVDETDIGSRLDRLPVTRLHVLAIGLCALGFLFDLLEIALGSALAAVFSMPPHAAQSQQLSLLLASAYIGAVIGAPLMGWWADRHGRRIALIAVFLWLAFTSLGAAASNDVQWLTLFRGLSGLALGACPPLVIAYLTDLLPPGRRGMLVFVTIAIATLGAPAGIFLVRGLTPLQPLGIEAWRWAFVVGGVGAAVVGVLFRGLPESARWLSTQGRHEEAERAYRAFERSSVVLPALNADAAARTAGDSKDITLPSAGHPKRRWLLVAALFLLSPWSTVAFPLLTGAVLAQKGFRLDDTLLYVGLSFFGPLFGTLMASLGVDRIGRRTALALCAGIMVASGIGFSASNAPLWLIVASVAFTITATLYVSTLNVYGAELFPTRSRASAIASAWALNRVGAAVAPLVLLPLLRNGGAMAMFAVIAATLIASIVLLAVSPRGRQRLPVV